MADRFKKEIADLRENPILWEDTIDYVSQK